MAGPVRIDVRVTPKGGRDAIEGWMQAADGRRRLRIRVTEAPDRGRANRAVCRLIAAALDVPAGSVAVTTGLTGREKTISIDGDAADLAARIAARFGGGQDG